ncbi:Ser/Thr protein kinase [Cryptosporidium sp. 43IA8]|nr:Ser/Thr protein kinase [Cryptosporidium sp. 43IA8]
MYNCVWKDSDSKSIKMNFPPYYYNLKDTINNNSEKVSHDEIKMNPEFTYYIPNLNFNPNFETDFEMNTGSELNNISDLSMSSLNLILSPNSRSQNPSFWPEIPEYNLSFGIHTQSAIKIAKGIATGCLYLKQRGIFHLNLKPTNILIEEDLSVKLADFGHCLLEASFYPNDSIYLDILGNKKVTTNTDSNSSLDFPNLNCSSIENEFSFLNQVSSSPRLSDDRILNYLPPEVLKTNSPLLEPARLYLENKFERCQSIDSYSIGAILWEMINGQPPFGGLGNLQVQAYVGYSGATLDLNPVKDSLLFSNISLIQGLVSRCCGFSKLSHILHFKEIIGHSKKRLMTSSIQFPQSCSSSSSSSSSSQSLSSSSSSSFHPTSSSTLNVQNNTNIELQVNKVSWENSYPKRISIVQILKELKAIERMVSSKGVTSSSKIPPTLNFSLTNYYHL